jgi:hypothetical protein
MRLTSTVIESTSERNREANWRVLRIRDCTHSSQSGCNVPKPHDEFDRCPVHVPTDGSCALGCLASYPVGSSAAPTLEYIADALKKFPRIYSGDEELKYSKVPAPKEAQRGY